MLYFECAHRHGGDSIFAEKVSYNMSKNKLVRKKRRDIGLVWELVAPGYGLLVYDCSYFLS